MCNEDDNYEEEQDEKERERQNGETMTQLHSGSKLYEIDAFASKTNLFPMSSGASERPND